MELSLISLLMKKYKFPSDLEIKKRSGITNKNWLEKIKLELETYLTTNLSLEKTYNIKIIYLDKCQYIKSHIYIKFSENFTHIYDNMIFILRKKCYLYAIDISFLELYSVLCSSRNINYVLISQKTIALM